MRRYNTMCAGWTNHKRGELALLVRGMSDLLKSRSARVNFSLSPCVFDVFVTFLPLVLRTCTANKCDNCINDNLCDYIIISTPCDKQSPVNVLIAQLTCSGVQLTCSGAQLTCSGALSPSTSSRQARNSPLSNSRANMSRYRMN